MSASWPMALLTASDFIKAQGHICIAFSGGPDSVCLAHLISQQVKTDRITCIHINHGLDPGAWARAEQAKQLAEAIGLKCQVIALSLNATSNIEARARDARYETLKAHLAPGGYLLTAHHADDVAETMVLRMLRGASPAGLIGIRPDQAFGQGRLIRPLLAWTKADVLTYLDTHHLQWIEDPTNACLSLDRNFVRANLMPAITARFPGAVKALQRSASLNDQAHQALMHYIQKDVQAFEGSANRLSTTSWGQFNAFHQGELIRQWCLQHQLHPPPGKPLDAFVAQIRSARPDACPRLSWDHASVYFYQNTLWLDTTTAEQRQTLDEYHFHWNGEAALSLPPPLGRLIFDKTLAKELNALALSGSAIRVQSGRPGESIQLAQGNKKIKDLMSQAHIPPWQRAWWPRLYVDNTLMALGQRWQNPSLPSGLGWETECFGA